MEKSYETKQYKKGLKAADTILKKFPNHGETLSMKGLTLNCMDRKQEAYELVRLGLKNDLKSHVCWHVYGLLYRSDRDYREAIKCYRNALRIDPDNIEILRDLSLLQAQMRDLAGFVETRQQLLTLKPNHRMNWIGFAVSHHLNSNASKAIDILEAYEGTLEEDYPPENERCEHGEMLLYKVIVVVRFIECIKTIMHVNTFGRSKKPTAVIHTCSHYMAVFTHPLKLPGSVTSRWRVDKLSYKEEEVSLLVKLNNIEEGEKLYRVLLTMNPDNYSYYEGLQKCIGLYSETGQYSSEEIDKLDALYQSLGEQYTWSSAVKRIPLDFLDGDKFLEAADDYVRHRLTRGVPSLFSDLSPLYDHAGKADILEKLVLGLEDSLKKTGGFPESAVKLGLGGRLLEEYSVVGSEKEPPSTLMWTLFYLAQHYDRRAQYDMALAKIDEAMQHTPTVIDLYSVKLMEKLIYSQTLESLLPAFRSLDDFPNLVTSVINVKGKLSSEILEPVKSKILKHAGDFVAAAALADEARSMDLADRYVNSQCVKRMLQADQAGTFTHVPLAEKTAVLFTKDGEQHNNLHDMQCMWYEIASGESYVRQGDLGRALKSYLTVEKHYADITEDQFDFHSYCLRKMTLRSYIEMLRFQDRLHAHAYFRKAAAGAIRCYIKLYDSPPKSSTEEDDEMAKLPASQKKKLRQKQRKAAKKEAEVKSEEANVGNVSKSGKKNVKAVDPDPNGEKLLQIEDPLMEAGKYLKLLQKHSSDYLETHLLSFEVNMRKQKILLALQALKHLVQLDAENPDTHRCLIRFFHKVASMSAPTTDAEKLISGVVEAERPTFSQLHGKSLMEANTAFLEQHKDSLMHRAAVAEMIFCLEPNKKVEAIKLIEESSNNPVSSNGALGSVKEWKLKDCVAVHKLLVATLDDRDAALRWKTQCAEDFPYSTYLEGSLCSSKASKQIHENAENGGIELPSPNGKVENLEAMKNLAI
ncbi:tetratricopeptide repeat (TPR)-containing protein [Artemisia annua]|uniref:Tetratricopeptide repeat (TPR)-containing protein n=1 Tax=Artemisia annua TaxID=35608 RepID=A0A2U1MSP8_ARTAN|nr:tetratricopeptide repeat (TPR)-containing protein [Artemisia annua]